MGVVVNLFFTSGLYMRAVCSGRYGATQPIPVLFTVSAVPIGALGSILLGFYGIF